MVLKIFLRIGDICFQTTDKNYPNGHPQLAQVAIQQRNFAGKKFKKIASGEKPETF